MNTQNVSAERIQRAQAYANEYKFISLPDGSIQYQPTNEVVAQSWPDFYGKYFHGIECHHAGVLTERLHSGRLLSPDGQGARE